MKPKYIGYKRYCCDLLELDETFKQIVSDGYEIISFMEIKKDEPYYMRCIIYAGKKDF